MGPPPNPDAMLEMMDNPMFLSQMNEAMNNPAVVDMMLQSPMVRFHSLMLQKMQSQHTIVLVVTNLSSQCRCFAAGSDCLPFFPALLLWPVFFPRRLPS